MPTVAFAGFPHAAHYSVSGLTDACAGEWQAGDARDVTEEDAAYLCATHPAAFSLVAPPRALSSPVRAVVTAYSAPETSLLDGSIPMVRKALQSGAHDAELEELESAEMAGKTRKGVLAVIADRRAEIGG